MASPTPVKATLVTGTAIALVAGALVVLAVRNSSPVLSERARPASPPLDTRSAVVPPAARADYNTSDVEALAASLVARPPTREEFAALRARLGRGLRLSDLFHELGRRDFAVALRLAEFTESAHHAKARAVWGCAEVDPDQALEWALANPHKSAESTTANLYLQNWVAVSSV